MDMLIGVILVAVYVLMAMAGSSQGRIYAHGQMQTSVEIETLKKVLALIFSILLCLGHAGVIYVGLSRLQSGGVSFIIIAAGGLVIYAGFFWLSKRRVQKKIERTFGHGE